MSPQRLDRAAALRTLALSLMVVMLSALPFAVDGASRPGAAPGPAVAQLPGVVDGDACGLLSDADILAATGATRVRGRTPNLEPIIEASCTWQLETGDGSGSTAELVVAVQTADGRTWYDSSETFQTDPQLAGIGDRARISLGQLHAVKGDVYLRLALSGAALPRPTWRAQRALAFLILTRITPDQAVGPSRQPFPSLAPLSEARRLALRLRAPTFGPDVVDAAIELLARSGIGTYAEPTAGEPLRPIEEPRSPVVLLLDQVRAMALEAWAGSGFLGSDLDELVTADADLATVSIIVGGYVDAVNTLGAEVGRELMGPIDWSVPDRMVFPQLVLTLMASDLAREQVGATEGSSVAAGPMKTGRAPAGAPMALAMLGAPADPRVAQGGICSAAVAFVSNAIAAVFNALRLDERGIGGIFATIWNRLLSLAELAVRAFLREFGQPVLDMIARVAAAVATASLIVSAVRPWTVTVRSDPFTTSKGVDGRPGEAGAMIARVDLGGFDEWPPHIADCAAVAGRPLPNLKPEGAPVEWSAVLQAPDGLIEERQHQDRLDANAEARLEFMTLVDDVREPWSRRAGVITARVLVERPALRQLRDVAVDQLMAALPRLVRGVLEPYLRPTLNSLALKLERLLGTQASSPATVFYHLPEPTPPPPTPDTRALQVVIDVPPGTDVVLPGRVLEVTSCHGPYGPWSGTYRIGGIVLGSFTLPIVEIPLAFSFPSDRGVQRTRAEISGGWSAPGGAAGWVVEIRLDIAVDGTTMTIASEVDVTEQVQGDPLLGVDGSRGVAIPLPIVPAPAGTCG